MSFFDQHYYALNKSLMSHIGIWPEQSKFVRIIKPMTLFIVIMSGMGPTVIRLYNVWGDLDAVIIVLPAFLCSLANFVTVLNSAREADKMKFMLEKIKAHWKIFKNTSAVGILEKYAERGRYLTAAYSIFINIMLALYSVMSISPVILDMLFPLNETRPKHFLYEADYGVDSDKYYWLIFTHIYIVSVLGINIVVTIDTMYIMWVEHACALFEIVGLNLKLLRSKKKKAIAENSDEDYRNIRDCIIIHKEAISFADMIENIYSGSMMVVIGITTVLISITGAQAVIKMEEPDVLVQLASFTSGQVFHLFFNSIPGQRLMEQSEKIHTFACDMCWYDMSTKDQKLLIPILIRSKKPCLLTAGKVYILSMESFAVVMEKSVSYLMVFARMLEKS